MIFYLFCKNSASHSKAPASENKHLILKNAVCHCALFPLHLNEGGQKPVTVTVFCVTLIGEVVFPSNLVLILLLSLRQGPPGIARVKISPIPSILAATFQPYSSGSSHPSVLSLSFVFLGMGRCGPEAMLQTRDFS